jgi:Cupin domain
MITRRELTTTLGASLVALLSGSVTTLGAEAAAPRQTAKENAPSVPARAIPTLLQESIGDLGEAEATMLILNFPPRPAASPSGRSGRPFPAHEHPGPVFAYVLEGSVENQVDPGGPKTYQTGDYWYEPAMHVHRSMRNLSDTQPAKVLVFEVTPKGKPLAMPAK